MQMINLRVFFLFLLILMLPSCVEIEEEMWINSDGSGRLMIHQELPGLAAGEIGDPQVYVSVLREIDELEDEIEITELFFEERGTELIFHLDATFESVMELERTRLRWKRRQETPRSGWMALGSILSGQFISTP